VKTAKKGAILRLWSKKQQKGFARKAVRQMVQFNSPRSNVGTLQTKRRFCTLKSQRLLEVHADIALYFTLGALSAAAKGGRRNRSVSGCINSN